jgi:hypothetical protein
MTRASVSGIEMLAGDPRSVDIRCTENNYSIRDRSTDRVVYEIGRRAGKQEMGP